MPTAGTRFETATNYGALDSDAFAQGRADSAHIIREISRNANLLYSSGLPIFTQQWNVNRADDDLGAMSDYATFPQWQKLTIQPIPCPKQPQLRSAYVDVRAVITSGQTLYMQVGTNARPFSQAARVGDENVFALAGTGGWADYEFSGLPLGPGSFESIDYAVQGRPRQTLASSVGSNAGRVMYVYSTHSVGDQPVQNANGFGRIVTDQTFGGNIIAGLGRPGRYWVGIYDSTGALLEIDRVLWVNAAESISQLVVYKQWSIQELELYNGATFQIFEPTIWRLGSLAITETDEVLT